MTVYYQSIPLYVDPGSVCACLKGVAPLPQGKRATWSAAVVDRMVLMTPDSHRPQGTPSPMKTDNKSPETNEERMSPEDRMYAPAQANPSLKPSVEAVGMDCSIC